VYENNVILRTDRPIDRRPTDPPTDRPTDLAFWKISNGHISATVHPIHFMFGSVVGFSRSADRMDLIPVAPNPNGKFQMAISPERGVRSTSCLILCWIFRERRIEWTYFWLHQIQDSAAHDLGKFRMTISLESVIRSAFMNYRAAWRNSLQEKIMREE